MKWFKWFKKEQKQQSGDFVRRCNCKSWEKSNDQIIACLTFCHEQIGFQYTGEIWKYCPWCSKELITEYLKKDE